jgi:serine/threonine protein kinase
MGENCEMSLCHRVYENCSYDRGGYGGVETTSAHLGDFKLLDSKGEEKGRFRDLHDADLHGLFRESHTLHQESLQFSVFSNKGVKIVGERLGKGAFGTAFRCQFRGIEYVIKLPNQMLENGFLFIDDDGFLVRSFKKYDDYSVLHSFYRGFFVECRFNGMALESPTHRRLRQNDPGDPLNRADHGEYMRIKNELDIMKSHEGYKHIHKILGFVQGFPAIFSEQCSGSLQGLIDADSNIFLGGYANRLSYQWLELAKQIGNAIEYLKDIARIVHLDIKPDNILYNESKDENGKSVFIWKLSDFGKCKVWKDDGGYTTSLLDGTDLYLPKVLKDIHKEKRRLSFDAYECSLHSYMVTLIMSIKFDIPEEEGYLQDQFDYHDAIDWNDAVECVKSVFLVLHTLEGARDGGNDYVLGNLAKMFFSELSDKPNIFISLMDSIKLELFNRQTPAAVREPSPILLIESQVADNSERLMRLADAAARRRRSSSDKARASRRPRY